MRPNADVIACVRALIGDDNARCLLLGSTSEYAALGLPIFAIDLTFARLAGLWRGDDSTRLCAQADWAQMPIASGAFTHVLGDGSLNAVPFEALPSLLAEVARVAGPRGTLIARTFCRPEVAEASADIREAVRRGQIANFHALKWHIAMSLLSGPDRADLRVTEIRDAFCTLYPDRPALCRDTGWERDEVDTIDVYDGSTAIYNFPTEAAIVAQLRRRFTTVETIRCGTYPLAERCPLLVARNPKL